MSSVIDKLEQTLNSEQGVGPDIQLLMLERLASCMQLVGKANETNLKSLAMVSKEEPEDDSEFQEKSAAGLLEEVSGRIARRPARKA